MLLQNLFMTSAPGLLFITNNLPNHVYYYFLEQILLYQNVFHFYIVSDPYLDAHSWTLLDSCGLL